MNQYDYSLRRLQYLMPVLLLLLELSCGQRPCTTAELISCTYGRTDILFTNGQLINLQNPEENCRSIYPLIRTCFKEVLQSCGTTIRQIVLATGAGAGIHLLENVCLEETIEEYKLHGRCLERPIPAAKIYACGEKFANLSRQTFFSMDFCNTVQQFRACIVIGVNNSCGPGAARFLDNIIAVSAESGVAAFHPNCDIRAPLNNYCYPNPCKNGGVCDSPSGQPLCTCQPGYNNTYCENRNMTDTGIPRCMASGCPDKSEGLSLPYIIGIVLGIIVLLLVIGVIGHVVCYRKCSVLNKGHVAQSPNTNQVPNPQTNSPDNISLDYLHAPVYSGSSLNSDYLNVYDPHLNDSQRSTGNDYSYVRNPEKTMKAIQATFSNNGQNLD